MYLSTIPASVQMNLAIGTGNTELDIKTHQQKSIFYIFAANTASTKVSYFTYVIS